MLFDSLGRPMRFIEPGQEADFGVITVHCINEPTDLAVKTPCFTTPSPEVAVQQEKALGEDELVPYPGSLDCTVRQVPNFRRPRPTSDALARAAYEYWRDRIESRCLADLLRHDTPPKNEDK